MSILGNAGIEEEEYAGIEEEEYAGDGKPTARLLGVVYRVKNLDLSVQFYTECLGMKLLAKYENALKNYTSALVGYGPQTTHFTLELRHYHQVPGFNVGTGFGHIGINVEDVYKSLELIKDKGGKVIRDAVQLKGASTVCAFIEDPNGYEIELLQRCFYGDPLCQVMLRVVNLNQAIIFYEKAFQMEMLRTFELEVQGTKFRLAFLGFGPEDKTTVLELNCILGVTEYDKGNAFLELIIGVKNISQTCKCVQDAGGEISQGNDTCTSDAFDLEGWKMVLVKNTTIEEANPIFA